MIYLGPVRRGPAVLYQATRNRKLAPQDLVDVGGTRLRPVPRRPVMSATAVSIEATCPTTCRFRSGSCYAMGGFPGASGKLLDEAARGHTGNFVAAAEADLISNAFLMRGSVPQDGGRSGEEGRDLRVHVAGDVSGPGAVVMLAAAADAWRRRGGGRVFTFTHRRITRALWRSISVLRSVETVRDANEAIDRGYVPALVVRGFSGEKPTRIPGLKRGWRVLPCPYETRGRTCVQCRLCMDSEKLYDLKLAIGFAIHGFRRNLVHLPVMRVGA